MKYFKYIIGIQLFLGAIWSFYYSAYLLGFSLLILSSITLLPLIYNFFKNKIGGLKAALLILAVFLIFLIVCGVSYLRPYFTPVNVDKTVVVLEFEQNLISAAGECFGGYQKAFSSSLNDRNEQCRLISEAKKSCGSAQQAVNNINIQDSASGEIINLLKGAKSDAKNSLGDWEKLFTMYNNQCASKDYVINAAEAKISLISAMKNMYFIQMKLKKAKSIS